MSDLTAIFGTADGFDPMSVKPQADFTPVVPGKYPVEIMSAQMKKTKAGDGSFLEIVVQILDGPEKGRKIWDNLNLDNPNAQAVEIALRSLAALGRSLGLTRIPDSDLLIGKRCIACIKVKDGSNSIRTYEPLLAAAPVAPVPPTGVGSAPIVTIVPVPVVLPGTLPPAPVPHVMPTFLSAPIAPPTAPVAPTPAPVAMDPAPPAPTPVPAPAAPLQAAQLDAPWNKKG